MCRLVWFRVRNFKYYFIYLNLNGAHSHSRPTTETNIRLAHQYIDTVRVCVCEVWKETLQTAVAGKSNAIQVENAKPKGRAAEHWTRRWWRGKQLTAAQWCQAADFCMSSIPWIRSTTVLFREVKEYEFLELFKYSWRRRKNLRRDNTTTGELSMQKITINNTLIN